MISSAPRAARTHLSPIGYWFGDSPRTTCVQKSGNSSIIGPNTFIIKQKMHVIFNSTVILGFPQTHFVPNNP